MGPATGGTGPSRRARWARRHVRERSTVIRPDDSRASRAERRSPARAGPRSPPMSTVRARPPDGSGRRGSRRPPGDPRDQIAPGRRDPRGEIRGGLAAWPVDVGRAARQGRGDGRVDRLPAPRTSGPPRARSRSPASGRRPRPSTPAAAAIAAAVCQGATRRAADDQHVSGQGRARGVRQPRLPRGRPRSADGSLRPQYRRPDQAVAACRTRTISATVARGRPPRSGGPGDGGRIEGRHAVADRNGRIDQTGMASAAPVPSPEPQVEVEQRLQPEPVEDDRVPGLDAPVCGDERGRDARGEARREQRARRR